MNKTAPPDKYSQAQPTGYPGLSLRNLKPYK